MTIDDKIISLQNKKEHVRDGGGKDRIDKQHQGGKLTARERIDALLDPGTFEEISVFIKHRSTDFGLDKADLPGDAVVTGYGKIAGRPVFLYAQDFTVAGGSLGEMHALKITKAMDLALKFGAPFIAMNDSGGARIQEGIDSLKGYASIFYRNTLASGVIPQIAAIMGPCAGGAVYSPGLMDFVVMTEKANMFITGPKVVKAVLGEEPTMEELGGLAMHAKKSGNIHVAVQSDYDAIEAIKKLLSFIPQNNSEDPPEIEVSDVPTRETDRIKEIISDDPNKSYDVRDVIREVVDNQDFFELQEYFGQTIVIGFGRLNGKSVGIVANQPAYLAGVLDINSADKAARFVRFCDAFNIPILTFVDVPGYMPGVDQEQGGIIRHGAKLLYAYSEATTPKITVVLRKAYGGAYIAMGSKELGADLVFSLPTGEIAVMGAEGAADILYGKEIKEAENPETKRVEKINEYKDKLYNPYISAERGLIDDVIEPKEVRKKVISALNTSSNKRELLPLKKHGNNPL